MSLELIAKVSIHVLPIVVHFIESLHDDAVILGSNRSETKNNRKWHEYDALLWVVIYLAFWWACSPWLQYGYLIPLIGLGTRSIMLQAVLNGLRSLPVYYLGNHGTDGWCKRYLGERRTLILKLVVYVLLVWCMYSVDILK